MVEIDMSWYTDVKKIGLHVSHVLLMCNSLQHRLCNISYHIIQEPSYRHNYHLGNEVVLQKCTYTWLCQKIHSHV